MKADYENEPATRISIPANRKKDHDLESRLDEAVKNDSSTRFLQQRCLVAAVRERLRRRHPRAASAHSSAHIKPDRFADIQHSIGIRASEYFMVQLADQLRTQLTPTDLCGRFGGNGFLIMLEARHGARCGGLGRERGETRQCTHVQHR